MAKKQDVKQLLKKWSGAWEEAEAMERGMLPDGRYQFRISTPKSGSIIVQDSDDRVRARLVLEVVAGPEKTEGRKTTKSWGLFTEESEPDEMGLSILKTELKACGFDVDELDFDGLPAVLDQLAEGAVVDATVVTKNKDGQDRQNIYINGMAKAAAASSGGRRGRKRAQA